MKKLFVSSCFLLLTIGLLTPGCKKKEDVSDKEQESEVKVFAEETAKASDEKANMTSNPLDLRFGPLRDTTFDIKASNAPNSFDYQWQFPEHKFFDVKTDKPSSLLDSPTGFLADKTSDRKTIEAPAKETVETSDDKTTEAPEEKTDKNSEKK